MALRLNEGLGHTRRATGGHLKQPRIERTRDEGLLTRTTIAELCALHTLGQPLLHGRHLGHDHGHKLRGPYLPKLPLVGTRSLYLAFTLATFRRQGMSRSGPRCTRRGQPADHRAMPGCAKRTQQTEHGAAACSTLWQTPVFALCGLTFELTWRQRRDAKPAPQIMHTCTVARALWHAVGSQVERGVRPHSLTSSHGSLF